MACVVVLDAFVDDAEFVQEPGKGEFSGDDTDGAGDCFGVADDMIGANCHIIAAAGGDIVEVGDGGFAGVEAADTVPEEFTGQSISAGRIDVEDDGGDAGVGGQAVQKGQDLVGIDGG